MFGVLRNSIQRVLIKLTPLPPPIWWKIAYNKLGIKYLEWFKINFTSIEARIYCVEECVKHWLTTIVNSLPVYVLVFSNTVLLILYLFLIITYIIFHFTCTPITISKVKKILFTSWLSATMPFFVSIKTNFKPPKMTAH